MRNTTTNISLKNILRLDAAGALISAVLWLCVLPYFHQALGIPMKTCYFLGLFPVLFLIYDVICLYTIQESYMRYIRIIAWANLLYCVLSILVAIMHMYSLTKLGWGYITLEIIIVIAVASYELKIARSIPALSTHK